MHLGQVGSIDSSSRCTQCCDPTSVELAGWHELLPVSRFTVLGVDCSGSFVLYQRILDSLLLLLLLL